MCSAHHHRSSPTINKQLLIERVDIYCVSRINKYRKQANAVSTSCCSFMLGSEHVKDRFSAIGDEYGERIWTVHGLGHRRSLTAIIVGSQSTCGERDGSRQKPWEGISRALLNLLDKF